MNHSCINQKFNYSNISPSSSVSEIFHPPYAIELYDNNILYSAQPEKEVLPVLPKSTLSSLFESIHTNTKQYSSLSIHQKVWWVRVSIWSLLILILQSIWISNQNKVVCTMSLLSLVTPTIKKTKRRSQVVARLVCIFHW